MARVLAIDRGNASIKGALFEEGLIVSRWRSEEAGDIAGWIAESRPEGAAVSSVVRGWRGECAALLRSGGVENAVFAAHDSPWPFGLALRDPGTVGPDRLCAAAGAASRGASDAVIVDAGTAVTVDVLRGGIFEGGSIMPGYAMMLRCLGEGTSALPELDPSGELKLPPGRDTGSAILAGVAGAFRGGVCDLLRHSMEVFDDSPEVFITGGDAFLLEGAISPAPRPAPDIVLEGLNLLYGRNFG
jgi:type III pantothenate kinase